MALANSGSLLLADFVVLANLDISADLDEQTANLIIQLQIEDTESYPSKSKGKGRAGEVSDESLAFQLQKQELEKLSSLLADRRMTRSIASAVQTDGRILTDTLYRDDLLARDRELAVSLTNGSEIPDTASSVPPTETEQTQILDDELLNKMKTLYVSGRDFKGDEEEVKAESSTWAATRNRPPSRNSLTLCVACQEVFNFVDVARVPGSCRHEYCRACLEHLFELSIMDESLFPPRCCRELIPLASVRFFLKSDLVHTFEQKKIEYETPNRTYCCLQTCSTFINAEFVVEEIATCPKCGTRTCTLCKAIAHTGDCPNDAALQQVLEISRESGWQRCHACWTMVELQHGCNHMSCRCGAQFCYVCGLQWKTCACEQWDEHRLIARANAIVDRRPEHRLLPRPYEVIEPKKVQPTNAPSDEGPSESPKIENSAAPEDPIQAARDILVSARVQSLRENHECQHNHWRRVKGPHICEECYRYLNLHIYECRQCEIQVCKRCQMNGLL